MPNEPEPSPEGPDALEAVVDLWARDIRVADAVQANTERLAREHGFDLESEGGS